MKEKGEIRNHIHICLHVHKASLEGCLGDKRKGLVTCREVGGAGRWVFRRQKKGVGQGGGWKVNRWRWG